ncbi:hypothetical protein JHK82_029788 [Glycine max]|nr:hypothetical protein JHK82_029788 [Glycine max]
MEKNLNQDQRDDGFVFTSKQDNNKLFGDAHAFDKFKFSARKEQQSGNTSRINKSRAKFIKFSTPPPPQGHHHDFTLEMSQGLDAVYSNHAATRSCFLAFGEVEDASKYSKKCLQSGTDVCIDQKIVVEASDLLQKTHKVSELINHSDELLQRRIAADAERVLKHINEALMMSSYSEKLLEMKAEALFMLCRYEEVIQMCDETIGSAEKNSYPLDADCKVRDLNSSQLSKGLYFRLWQCSMMLKSYFHLRKLEEGLSLLEEQEEKVSAINNFDNVPAGVEARLFKIIGEAYAILSHPAKRSQYDSEEEMRNSQKKRHANSMNRNNVIDQTDNRRHWKEVWRSSGNSSFKDSEAGRQIKFETNGIAVGEARFIGSWDFFGILEEFFF